MALSKEKIIQTLKNEFSREDIGLSVKCVYLYGSVLKQSSFIKGFSDVDVLVVTSDKDYSLKNLSRFFSNTDQMNAKYQINFDISAYSESYVLNGLEEGDPFLNIIIRDGILIIDCNCNEKIKKHEFKVTKKTLDYEINYCFVVLGKLFMSIIEQDYVSVVNRSVHLAKYSIVMLILAKAGKLVIDDDLIRKELEKMGRPGLYRTLIELYNMRCEMANQGYVRQLKMDLSDFLNIADHPLKKLVYRSYTLFEDILACVSPYKLLPFEDFLQLLINRKVDYIRGTYLETKNEPTLVIGSSDGNIKILKIERISDQ